MQIEHVAQDARQGPTRKLKITPDTHGACIEFENSDEVVVIDLQDGQFTIYHYADGESEEGYPVVAIERDTDES